MFITANGYLFLVFESSSVHLLFQAFPHIDVLNADLTVLTRFVRS